MTPPISATGRLYAARHSWRVWLAAFALFAQVLLPVQVLRAATHPADWAAFCSVAGASAGHGVDLDGNPVSDAGHKTGMVCPLCATAGGAAVPPADPLEALSLPVKFVAVGFVRSDEAVPSIGGRAAYGSRAPPSFL